MNNKFRPLSRTYYPKNLSLTKITKYPNFQRKNMSSLSRKNNYLKPKLFSLLDINYKSTSRGTELPAQYRRLTDDESKRLFGFSYRIDFDEIKKKFEKNNGIKNMKNMKNKSNLIRSASDIGDRIKLKLKKNQIFDKKMNYNENKEEKNEENEDFKNGNNIIDNNELNIEKTNNINDDKNNNNEIYNIKKKSY